MSGNAGRQLTKRQLLFARKTGTDKIQIQMAGTQRYKAYSYFDELAVKK